MKVSELIEHLQVFNQDADISFRMYDGCCGDFFYLDDPLVEDFRGAEHAYIEFPALPFLASCMSSGTAKGRAEAACKNHVTLNDEEWKKFIEMLSNQAKPSPRLIESMRQVRPWWLRWKG